ncbi:adenylosuccinate lyase [Roseovarius sp. LXJ103]|uniref:adenylosuccinate lyase n=1 Tax=Roseovarius carneus TaxID=2853164 RepID=UPI000D60B9DC|nr:adenylosuccinate lyase [Roseovarius carneus]MBZ8118650.1 adenylosuccinate lyase [Roseovarius carneus]PWE35666.1 adenylosuccinate lyase [Pelagicola sp. LXJ1103]
MKTKILTAAFALAMVPGIAVAKTCNYGKSEQAMSCATGSSFDAATGTCVPVASS